MLRSTPGRHEMEGNNRHWRNSHRTTGPTLGRRTQTGTADETRCWDRALPRALRSRDMRPPRRSQTVLGSYLELKRACEVNTIN